MKVHLKVELKVQLKIAKTENTKLKKYLSYKEQEHIKETEQDTACSMHYHDTNLDIEESFRDVAAKEEEKQHIVSNRLKELVEYAGVFTRLFASFRRGVHGEGAKGDRVNPIPQRF